MSCSKCGSAKVIPSVRFDSQGEGGPPHLFLFANPSALVFKEKESFPLEARLCGDCGFVELYVANPTWAWEVHQRAGQKQG